MKTQHTFTDKCTHSPYTYTKGKMVFPQFINIWMGRERINVRELEKHMTNCV